MEVPISDPKYIFNEEKSYAFKEKVGISMSSDSGKIIDETGGEAFMVKGKHLSISDAVWLQTPDGGENIIGAKKKLLSMHETRVLIDSAENVLAIVKKRHMLQMKARSQVWVGPDNCGNVDFEIEGGYRGKNITITHVPNNAVCCESSRSQFNAKNILFDQDTYAIKILPQYDVAFMLMLIVVFDEMFNDENDN